MAPLKERRADGLQLFTCYVLWTFLCTPYFCPQSSWYAFGTTTMVLKVSGQRTCWSLPCTVSWKCDKGNSLQSWQSCPLDALGVSTYSPSCSWTLPDWSCTFLSFPFPLGNSVPGFQAQLMTQIGFHSDHVWVEKWGVPAKSLMVALATQGGHLHRGNLRVPGGPLGEGGAFLCHDCHLVVTSVTLSPPKATLSPRAGKAWAGTDGSRSCWPCPELERLCSLLHVKWLYLGSEMLCNCTCFR